MTVPRTKQNANIARAQVARDTSVPVSNARAGLNEPRNLRGRRIPAGFGSLAGYDAKGIRGHSARVLIHRKSILFLVQERITTSGLLVDLTADVVHKGEQRPYRPETSGYRAADIAAGSQRGDM